MITKLAIRRAAIKLKKTILRNKLKTKVTPQDHTQSKSGESDENLHASHNEDVNKIVELHIKKLQKKT